jgi:very-short-patch-repair endonuclease
MSKPKAHLVNPALLKRSRELRHPLTPAEGKVWKAVRRQQLGFKFRRQHPLGRFIADFFCAECRLVIEIDGDGHAEPGQAAYDVDRTGALLNLGCRVIRFGARQVETELPAVLEVIRRACEERQKLNRPSP